MAEPRPYIGRFAPSPTGPLHLGSLYTALASFLDARSRQGLWLLRIDDIDTPRNAPGAIDRILATLDAYGLYWDGGVYFQSDHLADYEQALFDLQQADRLYPCICSRKMLAELPGAPAAHDIYPGLCRDRQTPPAGKPHALRVRSDDRDIVFEDALQGVICQNLAEEHGDFILKRKEGIVSYQLACVIDDSFQQVTHVVRGHDLVDSTPKQIFLQQLIGLPTPSYKHVPVITDKLGYKLSKQTQAAAVAMNEPHRIMFQLLEWLQQNPPRQLWGAGCDELLEWAVQNWKPAPLAKTAVIRPEII
ncbi:MAG: tRNA glutamyl-Q(34) synthetase GluQRS [Gammaproteobacteria bacterium]